MAKKPISVVNNRIVIPEWFIRKIKSQELQEKGSWIWAPGQFSQDKGSK